MKAVGLGVVLAAATAAAQCPSYTLSSVNNTARCGVESTAGTNPSLPQWQAVFEVVSAGPSVWGAQGPTAANLNQGCNHPASPVPIAARFPCELLKAIAYQESRWVQFCVPTQPVDQVGGAVRTIISSDCGYGISQVTSGMHLGEAPSFDRARVAADPTYNLATGSRILGQKWSSTQCVGDNLPAVLEHWYTATWAYNGLSAANNPNNPNFITTRGVYRPTVGGAAPYQEKVWGRMEFPPSAAYWSSVAVAYPRLSEVGVGVSRPPALPDPSCASPTSCAVSRPLHRSDCFAQDVDGGLGPDAGAGDLDGGSDGGAEAGSDAGGSEASPTVLVALGQTVGPAAGCSCSRLDGLAIFLSLGVLRRRLRPKPGVHLS